MTDLRRRAVRAIARRDWSAAVDAMVEANDLWLAWIADPSTIDRLVGLGADVDGLGPVSGLRPIEAAVHSRLSVARLLHHGAAVTDKAIESARKGHHTGSLRLLLGGSGAVSDDEIVAASHSFVHATGDDDTFVSVCFSGVVAMWRISGGRPELVAHWDTGLDQINWVDDHDDRDCVTLTSGREFFSLDLSSGGLAPADPPESVYFLPPEPVTGWLRVVVGASVLADGGLHIATDLDYDSYPRVGLVTAADAHADPSTWVRRWRREPADVLIPIQLAHNGHAAMFAIRYRVDTGTFTKARRSTSAVNLSLVGGDYQSIAEHRLGPSIRGAALGRMVVAAHQGFLVAADRLAFLTQDSVHQADTPPRLIRAIAQVSGEAVVALSAGLSIEPIPTGGVG